MILKTTLNQLQDFFSNSIQKTIQVPSLFFEKKVYPLLLEISYTILSVFNIENPSGKIVFILLQTDQNRKIKGAPPEETYCTLYISMY